MKEALVIINAQNGMIDTLDQSHQEELMTNLRKAVDAAHEKRILVIYVKDNALMEKNTEGWELHSGLVRSERDLVVQKEGTDAFLESMLDDMLRLNGIEKLVVGGCKTEFSIDSTCRKATSFGYQAVLLSDAHSTSDNPVLTADQIIAHHNHHLSRINNLGMRISVQKTEQWIQSIKD